MQENSQISEQPYVKLQIPLIFRGAQARRTARRQLTLASFKVDKEKEIREKCKGIEDILNVINTDGSYLWKVRTTSKWFRKKFDLNIRDMKISYSPSMKNDTCCTSTLPEIEIADICEVRRGWKTDIFNKLADYELKKTRKSRSNPGRRNVDQNCCFSIIYGERKNKTLDLVAPSPEIANKWVCAIEHLLIWYDSKKQEEGYELWLRKKYSDADVDNNKCLTFQETFTLLDSLNIDMSQEEVKKLFDQANTRRAVGKGAREVLDEDEFLTLYFRLLQRPEIDDLFQSYSTPNGTLTAKQLGHFLRKEEGGYENITPADCNVLIQIYEHTDSKTKGQMTSAGFINMLLSQEFDIFNYKECKHITHDMTQPLSHYYIASSHNTYIAGSQLMGKSSVENYVDALKRGCKCVELDCWDGEDDEPIIWHGHTLTSKILLREVLQDAIKPYAFVVSPFPLILSLEVHCSLKFRLKMASLFKEIIGDLLYTTDVTEDMKFLPSPAQLQGKILLKGKTSYNKKQKNKIVSTKTITSTDSKSFTSTSNNGSMNSQRTETRSSQMSTVNVYKQTMTSNTMTSNTMTSNNMSTQGLKKDLPVESVINNSSSESEDSEPEIDVVDNITGQSQKLPREPLCALINLIQAVSFRSFNASKTSGKCYEMSSFGESNAMKWLKENPEDFVNYNKRQLARVYPGGFRAGSSNFLPIHFWTTGCQIVALNYKTDDIPNMINRALFKQNGGCGYVLKSESLRNPNSQFNLAEAFGQSFLLTVRIISAQHLPKVEGDSEIVDPYVEFKVIEAGEDPSDEKFTTKKIQNNGFNPVWNETFQVVVTCPELAFACFRVRDHAQKGADLPLGYYIVPCTAMVTGYRHIHLENYGGETITPSTLFVHISITTPK